MKTSETSARSNTMGMDEQIPSALLRFGSEEEESTARCHAGRLYDQHGITVWTEAVALVKGDLIGVHDIVETSESGHRHQHC